MAATRLYLRALATSPNIGEFSATLPVGTDNSGGVNTDTDMSTAKGAAQTSNTVASLAQTAQQSTLLGIWAIPFTSFTTLSVTAQTWTAAIASAETNTNANSFLRVSLYIADSAVSTVRGYIYDGAADLGIEVGLTEDGQVVTFSGSAVSASVSSDLLRCEVWHVATQAMNVNYNQIIYFDGTTDVTGSTTTDAASYIETPQDLLAVVAASDYRPTFNPIPFMGR